VIGEASTTSRILEFLHLPAQHSPEALREVYSMISAACGYDNFIREPGGARLESFEGESGGISRLTFARDRITFLEERARTGLDHFSRRVDAALRVAAPKLGIPLLIARTVTQRAFAQIPSGERAPGFLARTIFRIGAEDLGTLGRPAQVVGLRLDLPSRTPQDGAHRVRVETYLRDPSSLFLEDIATFKVPVQSLDLAQVTKELEEVDAFLGDKLVAFLSGLDR
jgi:hypothetical protein